MASESESYVAMNRQCSGVVLDVHEGKVIVEVYLDGQSERLTFLEKELDTPEPLKTGDKVTVINKLVVNPCKPVRKPWMNS